MEAVAPGRGWGAVGWGEDGGVEGKDSSSPRLQERPRMPQPLNPQGHTAVTFVLSPDPPALTLNSFLMQMCLLGETARQPSELMVSFFIRINKHY